ncbi:protein of unknown function [Salegentibacter echinorum]|uniref:Uncharacterized protein n=1 Tax=Salegentibacter echinorum TaxID=1073325 RepID=A0A1M5KTS7_SALEC|nr:DUF4488 domain-containing protein [Salegentibacter echinorum]SHG56145.1 protein of unknown function [Salegentibacter echinorum]
MKKIIKQSVFAITVMMTIISCGVQKVNSPKDDLIGTWQMCNAAGEVEENLYGNKNQIRYKIISSDKFTLIDLNSKHKQVLNSFVGSYTIDKDVYTEHILYTNSNFNTLLGDTFSYKYKIEDDLLTIEGIGNPYNEIWKKVE